MLENHSFDNIFGLSGIPGIRGTSTSAFNSFQGKDYHVRLGAPDGMPTDPGHEFPDVVEQLAGEGATYPHGGPYPSIDNSGFAANYATTTTEGPAPSPPDIGDIMACFDTPVQLPVIYALATEFAICDNWFSSLPGPTWPNRFFLHGASSSGLDHSPTKEEMIEWESVFGFRYPNGSIFNALDGAGVSVAFYVDTDGPLLGSIPQAASIHDISIFDFAPLETFESDLAMGAAQYTFIEPNYGDISGTYEGGSSQHPMDSVIRGEGLIKKVYEAIRNSPVWDTSLLIITYDEHGGFFDSVRPGKAVPPRDCAPSKLNEYGFDFCQYGVRVPAVIVSPWIAKGTVDHTLYDHTSALATIESLFDVPPLTERDKSANNVLALVTDTLRNDCPAALPDPAPMPDRPARPPEIRAAIPLSKLTGNMAGFLAILMKTQLEVLRVTSALELPLVAHLEAVTRLGLTADVTGFMNEVMAEVQRLRPTYPSRRRRPAEA